MKEDSKQRIMFEYSEEDAWKVFVYFMFIEKQIANENKIPARVLKKFFEFFNMSEIALSNIQAGVIEKAKIATIKRYSKDNEYTFSKMLKSNIFPSHFYDEIGDTAPIEECSLKGMLDHVFSVLKNNAVDVTDGIPVKKLTDKREVIQDSLEYMDSYFNQFHISKEECGDIISHYKKTVIAGYICHSFGHILSTEIKEFEGKEPTNEMLFQATRYYTKKKV